MLFDLTQLPGQDCYKLLSASVLPRPIAWISTSNEDGGVNVAPYSFFNVLAGSPPVVAVGISSRPSGERKDTGLNIQRSGEFVVNLVSEALAAAMNVTAIEFPPGVSELVEAGLQATPSTKIAPPRIVGSPVALECRLRQSIDLGIERLIVLGDVLAMHLQDDAVIDRNRCHIDGRALHLIGRMHGAGGYVRTNDFFTMKRDV